MKSIQRFLFVVLATLGGSTAIIAQSTANATATATILTAISIAKTVDLNFGNVAVQESAGGTVMLTPLGVRSVTGGVTLPASAGTVTAASFNISGEGTYTYSITLPSSAHTITSGANSMTVTAFSSLPSGIGTLTAGAQVLKVGATLNVTAAQPNGTYASETGFNVTVNYN